MNTLDLGGTGPRAAPQPSPSPRSIPNSSFLEFNGANNIVNLNATAGSGLTYNVSAPITLGAPPRFRAPAHATFNFSGVISGTGGIIKTGSSTLTISGTDLYNGPTTVSAGILDLSTLNGAAGSSAVTVDPLSQLIVDYGTASGTAAASVTRTGSLTLDGGKLTVNGTSAGNTNDIFGALTLGAGASVEGSGLTALTVGGGNNVILVTPGTGKNAVLTFSSLAYTAGGTVLFSTNGTGNIGASTIGTARRDQCLFYGQSDGGQRWSDRRHVYQRHDDKHHGDHPQRHVQHDRAVDFATDFVTYDPTYGVRTITTYQSNSFALNGGNPANVSLSTQDTSGGSGTINSLLVNAGSFTETLSGTLIDNSGAILFNGNSGGDVISGGTLQLGATGATGTAADAFITTRQNVVNSIDSVITGPGSSNNLTLSFHNTNGGVGAFVLGATNTYAGGTIINSSNSADIVFLGGTASGTAGTFTITPGTNGSFGAGNVSLNNVTVDLNHSNTYNFANNFTGTGVSVINQIGSSTTTLSGNISGTIGVSESSTFAGTLLVLTGSNTYTGATTLGSGGTLQLQGNSGNTTAGVSSALSNSSVLSIGSVATLQLRADNATTFAPSSTAIAVGTANINNTLNIDVSDLTGAGTGKTLTLGGGTLTFAANTSGTETNTINVTSASGGDTLALGTVSAPSSIGGGPYPFIINNSAAAVTIGAFDTGGLGSILTFTGSNTATLNGLVLVTSGSDGVTVNGPTVVLAESNVAGVAGRTTGGFAVVLAPERWT